MELSKALLQADHPTESKLMEQKHQSSEVEPIGSLTLELSSALLKTGEIKTERPHSLSPQTV